MRTPHEDEGILISGVDALGQLMPLRVAQHGFQHLIVEHVGTLEAGDDLQTVGDFVGEYLTGLGEVREHATELRQLDELHGTAPGLVVEDGQVVGRERNVHDFHLPAFFADLAVEALLQLHQ